MTKNRYEMYLEQLETKVAEGDLMVYKWYNRISNAYLDRKLTRAEFRKLLKDGVDLCVSKVKIR